MARSIRRGTGRGEVFPHEAASSLLNPLRRLVQSPARFARSLQLPEDARVLELGPGPGYFSVEVARRMPRGQLVLADLQPEMLRMARRALDGAGIGSARFAAVDALQLPFAPGSFDAAFMVAVLGEVGDPPACLRELHRVIRHGGRLVVVEVRGDSDRITFDELRPMVEATGFELIERRRRLWTDTTSWRLPARAEAAQTAATG